MAQKFERHEGLWTDAAVANLWDHYAATLTPDKYFSHHSGQFLVRRFRPLLPPDAAVLDFGCGPGYLVSHLLRAFPGGTVHAMDFSEESVARTNAAHAATPGFMGAVRATGFPLPFPDACMDAVFSVEVIEHLRDEQLAAMLREVRRLLKPGGLFCVTTPHREDLAATRTICPECGCTFHLWQHLRSWDVASLRALLADGGLDCLDVRACRFESRRQALFDRLVRALHALQGRSDPVVLPHLYGIARKHG